MKVSRISSRNADTRLNPSLTTQFIQRMKSVLATDSSPKGRYLEEQWLTKYCEPDPLAAKSRRTKAIEKWLSTERRNLLTNQRLTSRSARAMLWSEHSFQRVIVEARKIILRILGPTPSLCPLHGGFSGGATTSKKRTHGHPAMKFLGKAHVTREALPLFHDVSRGTRWAEFIHKFGLETEFIRGNVLFTVPKSSDIDRVAAKEPDLNIFLQKLFGNQIRWLLRKEGIDLNDQTINGELARQGSISNRLMTMDLSSASDSVTIELVRALLPFEWFYYLDMVRSPFTSVDGEWHQNQMFSSMGNGFTFELESLLFYSLARAVAYLTGTPGKISVYGDDIVAPSSIAEPLTAVLGFCGFRVNEDKTFHDSPFRESCGYHWIAGMDVKPFYLRRPLQKLSDLILILNSLTRWATEGGIVDPTYEDVILEFSVLVPNQLWGGQDLSSRSSLVTGDRPRKRLVEVTGPMVVSEEGSYLQTLLSIEPRRFQASSTDHSASIPTGFCRIRRNKEWDQDLPLFLTRVTSQETGVDEIRSV